MSCDSGSKGSLDALLRGADDFDLEFMDVSRELLSLQDLPFEDNETPHDETVDMDTSSSTSARNPAPPLETTDNSSSSQPSNTTNVPTGLPDDDGPPPNEMMETSASSSANHSTEPIGSHAISTDDDDQAPAFRNEASRRLPVETTNTSSSSDTSRPPSIPPGLHAITDDNAIWRLRDSVDLLNLSIQELLQTQDGQRQQTAAPVVPKETKILVPLSPVDEWVNGELKKIINQNEAKLHLSRQLFDRIIARSQEELNYARTKLTQQDLNKHIASLWAELECRQPPAETIEQLVFRGRKKKTKDKEELNVNLEVNRDEMNGGPRSVNFSPEELAYFRHKFCGGNKFNCLLPPFDSYLDSRIKTLLSDVGADSHDRSYFLSGVHKMKACAIHFQEYPELEVALCQHLSNIFNYKFLKPQDQKRKQERGGGNGGRGNDPPDPPPGGRDYSSNSGRRASHPSSGGGGGSNPSPQDGHDGHFDGGQGSSAGARAADLAIHGFQDDDSESTSSSCSSTSMGWLSESDESSSSVETTLPCNSDSPGSFSAEGIQDDSTIPCGPVRPVPFSASAGHSATDFFSSPDDSELKRKTQFNQETRPAAKTSSSSVDPSADGVLPKLKHAGHDSSPSPQEIEVSPYDFVLEKGHLASKQLGNRSFFHCLDIVRPVYIGSADVEIKRYIRNWMIYDIESKGGRFLARENHTQNWFMVPAHSVHVLISMKMRDSRVTPKHKQMSLSRLDMDWDALTKATEDSSVTSSTVTHWHQNEDPPNKVVYAIFDHLVATSEVCRQDTVNESFTYNVAIKRELSKAWERGEFREWGDVVKSYLDALRRTEATWNFIDPVTGLSLLHLAIVNNQKGLITDLLSCGAKANDKAKDGSTALHFACRTNNKDVVVKLLESGADVNAVTNDGSAPLHIALNYLHKDMAMKPFSGGVDAKSMDLSKSRGKFNAENYHSLQSVNGVSIPKAVLVPLGSLEELGINQTDAVSCLSRQLWDRIVAYEQKNNTKFGRQRLYTCIGWLWTELERRHQPANVDKLVFKMKNSKPKEAKNSSENKVDEETVTIVIEKDERMGGPCCVPINDEEISAFRSVFGRGKSQVLLPPFDENLDWQIESLFSTMEQRVTVEEKEEFYRVRDDMKRCARYGPDQETTLCHCLSEMFRTKFGTRLEGLVNQNQTGNFAVRDDGDDTDSQDPGPFVMALYAATRKNQAAVISELLRRGANLNAKTKSGWTALHWASLRNNKDVVLELLEYGADINARSNDGWTPLLLACEKNHMKLVAELLEKRADPNVASKDDWTPLHLAMGHDNIHTTSQLLQHGADVHAKSKNGWTALHFASCRKSQELASTLLDSGADIHAKTNDGWTPLLLASNMNQHMELLSLLLENGADVKEMTGDGWTPLHLASGHNYVNAAKALLGYGADVNARANDGRTPLLLACDKNHTELALHLLENGADANLESNDGNTPLHCCSRNGNTELVSELLERGADVNDPTADGRTALHIAVGNGHRDVVLELLNRGADVNARSNDGSTPLHLAREKKHAEIIFELETAGAVESTVGDEQE